jgi:hypothetical protein
MFLEQMGSMEMKTHYAWWCIMAAPLILGHDLDDFSSHMTPKEFMAIVGNKEVL